MPTVREIGVRETHLAYPALYELRPHLTSLESFVAKVNQLQRPEGYRLVGTFEDGIEEAVAVAGFRTGHNLAWGHFLYVDDLSTREAFRQRGHAAHIFRWLEREARRLGCDQFHLDSGVHRHDAHRFYLNRRLLISSHHFGRVLSSNDCD